LKNNSYVVQGSIGIDRIDFVFIEVVFESVIFIFNSPHNAAGSFAIVVEPCTYGPSISHTFLFAVVFVEKPLSFGLIGVETAFTKEAVTPVFQNTEITGISHAV